MLLPVLGTFALVAAIIIAAYFLLILKPEQDEQSSLRRRMKGSVDCQGRPRSEGCSRKTPRSAPSRLCAAFSQARMP